MTVYLLAHGSADPRHAQDVQAIADRLGRTIGEPVGAAYLDLCPPTLCDVADTPGVVIPLLLSPGYHVQVDVAEAIRRTPTPLIGADPPLLTSGAEWGRDLIAELVAPWPDRQPVLVTAGTRDRAVLERWEHTARVLGVPVVHASGPGIRLSGLVRSGGELVAVPAVVARGHFADLITAQAAAAGIPIAAVAGSSGALVAELARLVRLARPG